MTRKRPTLSVILPTYNESTNLPILLGNLKTTLSEIDHEILVVDDNSPDRTWEIAEDIAQKDDSIRVIRRITDRGLSSAVITGMEVAEGDVFAVMDADLQHDENLLPRMVKALVDEDFDLVVGSRAEEGGSYGEWSRRRRFISWVATFLARTFLPLEIKDPMSGFFALKREVFEKSANVINPRGFKILLEFIGRTPGLKMKELGYHFRNRQHGETKLSGSVVRNYLVALFDLRFGKYISPTFFLYVSVGASGIIVNFIGFQLGEGLGLPKINTGLSDMLDPLWLSVPFGYQLAILSNYLLNNYVTFSEVRHRGFDLLKGLLYFEIISVLGLLVQVSVFQLLQTNGFMEGWVAPEYTKYPSLAAGIAAATVSNYFLNRNFTWKDFRP
ncbi:MAG: glycosyltransferase family 2 protein [Leptospiraceae bacterium]|nr:glycosyltransferase family 2 protein [Leptospiraceae bacterium]